MENRKVDAQKFLNSAIRCLSKKRDCKITNNNTILVLNTKSKNRYNDLGNRSKGYIDGLCHYFGYNKTIVDKF